MPLQRNDRDQCKTQGSSLSIPGVLPGCLTRKPQSWTRLSRTDIPSCSQAETWNSIVLSSIQAKRWAGPAYRPSVRCLRRSALFNLILSHPSSHSCPQRSILLPEQPFLTFLLDHSIHKCVLRRLGRASLWQLPGMEQKLLCVRARAAALHSGGSKNQEEAIA